MNIKFPPNLPVGTSRWSSRDWMDRMGVRVRQMWDCEKTRKFQEHLLDWYGRHKRELPWRSNPTPYRVWVSEVMLQQTQVKAVIPYYDRFLKRFPSIESLAQAAEHEIAALWAGLGYYSRARNLHRAAKLIVDDHGGVFPGRLEDILALPGIGRYTAGAICSIAFSRPQPIVDGNVRRVISRLHGIRNRAPEAFFWNQASEWVPEGAASAFNQAVMELGALVCVPSQPLCYQCPVHSFCKARKQGIQDRIPAPRATRFPETVEMVTLVLERDGNVLLTKLRAADYIPGVWGLPSQLLPKRRSPEAIASSFSLRLLGHTIPLQRGTRIRHAITYRRILAHVFYGKMEGPISKLNGGEMFRWAGQSSRGRMITSSLFRKVLGRGLGNP